MQLSSTWVVPPKYEALIVGFDAVEICARKAYLIQNGKRVRSAFYKQEHAPAKKTFSDWVTHIVTASS